MNTKSLIASRTKDFEKSVEHFRMEAAKLRTGRAHPSIVEDLSVDYYGSRTPLRQIATITVPEPRLIVIQPWDRDSLVAIAEAIRSSDLGLNPSDDGHLIRLNLPQLTEDRRKELVKTLSGRMEDARVAVRTIREEVWKEIQEMEKRGEIGEDEKFSGKDDLQKEVDRVNDALEAVRKKKEEDIMTV
ncbi:MAG: ribosome recycling factor [Candidatus Moranbacteria bacterium]|nr:ribosome recycling factor [Candidatus Moranbacteria bacterium]